MSNRGYHHNPWFGAAQKLCAAAGDLLVPQSCPGCGIPGPLCSDCRTELQMKPVRVSPRITPPVPVWSCGPYSGTHRSIVIAAKEHGDGAAREMMGATIAGAINHLVGEGVLDHPRLTPVVLIPAPTKASASRRRGGDPVAAACTFAAERLMNATVVHALETASGARDSSELGARGRRSNLSGRIKPQRAFLGRNQDVSMGNSTVVLVDDVVTTGATTAESTMVLASLRVRVDAVIAFTRA